MLVRADLDVPLSAAFRLTTDSSVRRLCPTLRRLVARGCKVVIAAHAEDSLSLAASAEMLGVLLEQPVLQLGRDFATKVGRLAEGQLAILPNLDEFPEERANDAAWAGSMARSFDVYVAEGSNAALQLRASTVALPRRFPTRGVGQALGNDLDMTRDFVALPAAPYVAVVGGNNLLHKAEFLRGLLARVDALLLGGVIGNTFLAASGRQLGASKIEADAIDTARELLALAGQRGTPLYLPLDGVFRTKSSVRGPFIPCTLDAWSVEALVDIGPQTRAAYAEILRQANTLLWNGALGEVDAAVPAVEGTQTVLRAAANVTYRGVVGVGSTRLASLLGEGSLFHWKSGGGEGSRAILVGAVPPGLQSLQRS